MKKALKAATAVLILLIAVFAVVWFMPAKILKNCTPQDITRIEVETDSFPAYSITDEAEVCTVAENIQSCGAKKDGISFGRMGDVYKLNFYKGDEYVGSFSVISGDTARDSVFFYRPENGSYCKEYLDRLTQKYRK